MHMNCELNKCDTDKQPLNEKYLCFIIFFKSNDKQKFIYIKEKNKVQIDYICTL